MVRVGGPPTTMSRSNAARRRWSACADHDNERWLRVLSLRASAHRAAARGFAVRCDDRALRTRAWARASCGSTLRRLRFLHPANRFFQNLADQLVVSAALHLPEDHEVRDRWVDPGERVHLEEIDLAVRT